MLLSVRICHPVKSCAAYCACATACLPAELYLMRVQMARGHTIIWILHETYLVDKPRHVNSIKVHKVQELREGLLDYCCSYKHNCYSL
jgi:hypothetical protein